MREWIFAFMAGAIIVGFLVYRGLQREKVGELLVPSTMMGMRLRLTVRRETVSVDRARVHAGISASGGAGLKALTDHIDRRPGPQRGNMVAHRRHTGKELVRGPVSKQEGFHMTPSDAALLATQLAMGFALAATVGLRTFLPLLAAGLLARFGYVDLGDSFAWMEKTPTLIVFGSAVIFEVLADKVPGLDHALHAVETFVKPVAGTLVAASLFTNLDPMTAVVIGLIGGGTIAGAVHVAKGATRAASTMVTGGLGNPVLSIFDDILAVGGIILAILAPIIAALIVLVLVVGGVRLLLKRRRRLGADQPS